MFNNPIVKEKITFEEGSSVYYKGQQCRFLKEVNNWESAVSMIVASISGNDYDTGPWCDVDERTIIVETDKLSNEPYETQEMIKYNDQIMLLRGSIAALKLEKAQLEADHKKEKQENDELLKKFRKIKELKNLMRILDGGVTHYVEIQKEDYSWGRVSILDINDTEAEYARRHEKRLLSLYGNTEGDFSWRLNRYADGSDRSIYLVIPCMSYEEAVEELTNWIKGCKDPLNDKIIGAVNKYGLDIDLGPSLEEKAKKELTVAENQYKTAMENAELAKAKILKLKGGKNENV